MAKKAKKLEITQVRSRSGRPLKQCRTLDALGFRRHQQTVVHNDTPQIRGMLAKIPHLVAVKEVEG